MEDQTSYFTKEFINKLVLESKVCMNSLSIQIPFAYAVKLVNLNWNDILFAINNEYFNYKSAIEYAIDLLDEKELDERIIELACLKPSEINKEEIIEKYVNELSNNSSKDERNIAQEKIMYILLSLLHDNIKDFEDPLQIIEIIYDDFNFPKSIENFVRYMQIEKENTVLVIEQYYENWEQYLAIQKSRFCPNN